MTRKRLINGIAIVLAYMLVLLGNLLFAMVNNEQNGTDQKSKVKCFDHENLNNMIGNIAFSQDRKYLAATYGISTAKLWNVVTGEVIHIFNNNGSSINQLQFSPDGKILAGSGGCGPLDMSPCSKEQLRFWSIKSGGIVKSFDDIPAELETGLFYFGFSPDGKYVATSEPDRIVIRECSTKKIIKALPVRPSIFSFSSDGSYIVTPDREKYRVIVWDVRTAKIHKLMDATELWKVDGVGFWSVSYSPDDKSIYLGKYEYGSNGYKNPQIIVFNVSNGKIIRKISGYNIFLSGSTGIMAAFNYSGGDPRALAIDILDTNSGIIVRTFKTCDLGLQNFSLSADGKMLAAPGYGNNAINIWDVSNGKLIRNLDN